MKKERLHIAGAIAVLAVFAIAGSIWYLRYMDSSTASATQSGASSGSSPISFVPTESGTFSGSSTSTAGFLYSNRQYHFSLMYPPDLDAKMYGGGGNALTVTFQDPTTKEGFQVFVVPYDEPQITKERFELDEPSGVLENPTAIVVGGVSATMFYSTNATMGDTREVWFINAGLLYEVTTYKQLDPWLANIMTTWKFI